MSTYNSEDFEYLIICSLISSKDSENLERSLCSIKFGFMGFANHSVFVCIKHSTKHSRSLCISVGEQWTPRAAGNQSGSFSGSEERRPIRQHVAVATAHQCRRELTKKLEPRAAHQTRPPTAAAVGYRVYSLLPHDHFR